MGMSLQKMFLKLWRSTLVLAMSSIVCGGKLFTKSLNYLRNGYVDCWQTCEIECLSKLSRPRFWHCLFELYKRHCINCSEWHSSLISISQVWMSEDVRNRATDFILHLNWNYFKHECINVFYVGDELQIATRMSPGFHWSEPCLGSSSGSVAGFTICVWMLFNSFFLYHCYLCAKKIQHSVTIFWIVSVKLQINVLN